MDLTTTTRVGTLVNPGETAPSAFTTLLGQIITGVSEAAERYLGRDVQSTSRTVYLDVEDGQRVFRLSAFPVSTVTSISYDPEQGFGADTALTTDDYYNPTYSTNGLLKVKTTFFPLGGFAPAALKIVYTGGMAANTAAFIAAYADVTYAIDLQCAHVWHTRNFVGTVSSSGDAGSISLQAVDWLPEVKAVLDRYRVRAI